MYTGFRNIATALLLWGCCFSVFSQKAEQLFKEGEAQLFNGRSDLAISTLNKAYSAYEKEGVKDSLAGAICLNELGIAHWNEGNNIAALNYLEEALRVKKNIPTIKEEYIAASYNDIGLVYSGFSQEKALSNYYKAINYYRKDSVSHSIKIAQLLMNMGIIYRQQEKYDKAQQNFFNAKIIFTASYSATHPTVAFAMANEASIYKLRGIINVAITHYEDALAIYKQNYGNKHPEIAQIYDALGQCYLQEEEYRTALEHYQKALVAGSNSFNSTKISDNPKIHSSTNQVILHTLFLKSQALQEFYYNHSLKIRDLKRSISTLQSCDTLLDVLRHKKDNDKDKIALGSIAEEIYSEAIKTSLALAEVSWFKNPPRELAFYFSEKAKSAVLLESITDSKAKDFANIPKEVLEKEKDIKATLTFLEQQSLKGTPEEKTLAESSLLAKYNEYTDFIKEIERLYPQYYALKYDIKTVDISSIQSKIDENTSVISYFISEKDNVIYTFYIRKKSFKVYTKHLHSRLSHDIKAYRNAIVYNSKKTYTKKAFKLYEILFPCNKISTKTIIIPHGALGLIPFEALLTEEPSTEKYADYSYLIKHTNVSYSYSATLLFEKSRTTSRDEKALVIAPIKFKKEGTGITRAGLTDLPGTAFEAKKIKEILGAKATIDTLSQASESKFKSLNLKEYTTIHFATHGLVNEENPELSQIFLANEALDSKEDGSLYAGELYNIEMNADLVVLSACETGTGKVTKGEGIIGLSRALIFSGAENLIVSLWKVSDQSTADLMMYFYREKSTKKDNSSAINEAKKTLITSEDYSSPYFWAPFILVGE